MVKKKPTKAESEHMGMVAAVGCVISNSDCSPGTEVHHKTGAGMGLRSSHFLTMALCFNHHSQQSPLPFGYSVHNGTKSFEERYGTQDYLIQITIEKIKIMQEQYS